MRFLATKKKYLFFLLGPIILCGLYLAKYVRLNKTITTIKIGNLLPLNPNLMAVAIKMKNGTELAREDLLEKYKDLLSIEMHHANGCFENETIPSVQKFIHDDVSIIGASFCLFGHIPILPLTEANKIITFNTASNPDVVLNKRYAFSINVEIKDQAREMADFAFKKMAGRRAIIMHLDTPFGHDYKKYFAREFEKLGGQLLFNIPNAPDGRDYHESISKIIAANPDVIITAHFGVPLGLFLKEIRAAGITSPIVGNYETEDSDVLDAAGSASEGVIFASSESAEKSDIMEKFEKRYVRKFGVAPDVVVTSSYDSIVIGVESYLKCNGDRDCMSDEIHQTKEFQGAGGVITIKSSGATDKPTTFKFIKNRTFLYYKDRDLTF